MKASIARSIGEPGVSGVDAIFDVAAELDIRNLAIQRERGKTIISGTARYQLDRERLFDAIKLVDGWESDVVVEVDVERHDIRGYHTVQAGETLAAIAKRHLGHASREMDIFDANRDRMNDPDQIFAGQQLLIPFRTKNDDARTKNEVNGS